MRTGTALLAGAAIYAVSLSAWLLSQAPKRPDLAAPAGLSGRTPPPTTPLSPDPNPPAGAAPSTPEASSGTPPAALPLTAEGGASGVSTTGLVLDWIGSDELDPGMYPTGEGLYARTTDLWSDAQFLEDVPQVEALLHAFGWMPTREECERFAALPEVREKLEVVCRTELVALALDARVTKEAHAKMVAAFHAAERDLYAELDRTSGWPHWSEMDQLWKTWGTD